MEQRLLQRLVLRAEPAGDPIDLAPQPPGTGQAEIVAPLLEERDRPFGDLCGLHGLAVGVRLEPHELPSDLGARRVRDVTEGCGLLVRLLEQRIGLVELAELEQDAREATDDLRPVVVALLAEPHRPLEEIDPRRQVAAKERPLAGAPQLGATAFAQRLGGRRWPARARGAARTPARGGSR